MIVFWCKRTTCKGADDWSDTRQVIARFEVERQALALMDHPNIAKVLDAGTIEEPRTLVSSPPQPQPLTDVRGSELTCMAVQGLSIIPGQTLRLAELQIRMKAKKDLRGGAS
jgi:hypothetical protein